MKQFSPQYSGFKTTTLVAAITAAMGSMVAQAEVKAESEGNEKEVVKTTAIVVVGQATSGLDSLITSEQLESYNATDMTDMFRRDPSISAGGAGGLGQKIYLRNVGEDSLHISIDGAEQAGSTFHHAGRVAIDPDLLKQIEVEAGAGSAAAGPGALGGSIRFVTKDPEDLLEPGENAGALLKTTYMSVGNGWKNTATVYGQDSKGIFSGMASLSGYEYDDLEDGNGNELDGTESDKNLGFLKLVANITDEQKLSLSYEKLKEEGDILYRPEWIPGVKNPVAATTSERKTTIFNYEYSPFNNEFVDLSVNAYQTENHQHREWGGTFGGTVDTHGFTVQNKSHIGNNELTYGVNYRNDESIYAAIPYDPSDYQKEEGDVKGLYVQDVISVNEKLTISTGLRYDHYEVIDLNDQKLSDGGFSPNISANYEIKPGISVSAGYADAFRGPEVRDSLKLSTSGLNNDPDLKGERAKNLELGLNFDGDDYAVGVGIYRSVVSDAILGENGSPWASSFENFDEDIETLGLFFHVEKDWDDLTVAASLNIADTEVNGEDASRYVYGSSATSIGDTLALSMDYQATNNLALGWSAEFVKGFSGDIFVDDVNYGTADLDYKKSGYAVHDVYARWLPLSDDQLTVTFSINNLFDKQFISHASPEDLTHIAGYEMVSGYAEEGRDIRLSLALKF